MLLAESQRAFAAAVADAALPPPASVEAGRAEGRRTARFNIYRNNVFVTLTGLLDARFPVVARLLGSEFFRATARAYATAEPPEASLLGYGRGFPSFLETFEPVLDVPYLPDVARIEWAYCAAYCARDAEALRAADFANRAPGPGAIPTLHPATGVVTSPYPVHTIWAANLDNASGACIELPDEGEAALVTRPDDHVLVKKIDPPTAAFALAVSKGLAIRDAYERTVESAPGFSLEHALRDLLSAGAIMDVFDPPTTRPEKEQIP